MAQTFPIPYPLKISGQDISRQRNTGKVLRGEAVMEMAVILRGQMVG